MRMSMKAVIAVVVMAVMCLVPLSAADLSDAAVDTGEMGIYVKADGISKDVIDRIFGGSEDLLDTAIVMSNLDFTTVMAFCTVNNIAVPEAKAEMSRYSKVNDESIISGGGETLRVKMTYDITFNADGKSIFADTSMYNKELVRYIGDGSANGGKMTVESDIEIKESEFHKGNYITKSDKDCVVTDGYVKTADEVIVRSKIVYTYSENGNSIEKRFSTESKVVNFREYSFEYDFDGTDPSKATGTTPVYVSYEIVEAYGKRTLTFDANGRSGGYSYIEDIDQSTFYLENGTEAKGTATVISDVKPMDFTYYGDSYETALFTSAGVIDTGLRSDSAMQDYLKNTVKAEMGHSSDYYGKAKAIGEAASSVDSGPSRTTDVIFYVIIAVLLTVIAVLAVIVYKLDKK